MSVGFFGTYSANKAKDTVVTSSPAVPDGGGNDDIIVGKRPSQRVRYNTGVVTVTLTAASPFAADTLIVPVTNAPFTFTNGAGLSEAVVPPTLPDNGIPETTALRFTSSISDVWNLVFSGATPLRLGGGLWLGVAEELDRDFLKGYHLRVDQPGEEQKNDYGVEYLPVNETQERELECNFSLSPTGVSQMERWHGDWGQKRPSFFWPRVDVQKAYVGRWKTRFDVNDLEPAHKEVTLVYGELVKGKPVV